MFLVSVVTGSTHGIGKAYAQELANCGVNIIIISLGQEDCETTAKYLGKISAAQSTFKMNTKELYIYLCSLQCFPNNVN